MYRAARTLHRALYRPDETGRLRSILCPRKFDRFRSLRTQTREVGTWCRTRFDTTPNKKEVIDQVEEYFGRRTERESPG